MSATSARSRFAPEPDGHFDDKTITCAEVRLRLCLDRRRAAILRRKRLQSRAQALQNLVAPSPSAAASAELLRARDVLRDVLIREDGTDEVLLMDEVRNGLDRVCRFLDNLAGKQMLFEFWVEMKQ